MSKIVQRLIQFCGTEDFLYENNQKFRKVAESNGYGHVYMEGPAGDLPVLRFGIK